VFGVCYRPPNQSAADREDFLLSLAGQLDIILGASGQSCFLMGDYNDACEVWESDHANSELGLKLYNLIKENCLVQLITKPTRGNNILDLLITDCPEFVSEYGVLPPIDNLDHGPIYGILNIKYNKQVCFTRNVRNYDVRSLELLNTSLEHVPGSAVLLDFCDVNDCVHFFTKIIEDEMNVVMPAKSVIIRPRDKPGMTGTVRSLFRKTHRLHHIAKTTKLPDDIENHRKTRAMAKKMWRRAQKEHFIKINSDKFSTGNGSEIKGYWKTIKSIYTGKNKNRIPTLFDGIAHYDSALSKANLLNKFFALQSTLNLDHAPALPSSVDYCTSSRISSIDVSSSNVFNILQSLEVGRASGPDDIGNIILKSCAATLTVPISIIIKKIFST